ncbi:MAG TPA: exodeoxyribonuclease III [Myxococcota bacterium]|nr:exodeoxyribonuclease III [Myxococcota bacterium]
MKHSLRKFGGTPGKGRGVARILSWNVNGLRACASKGFLAWLTRSGADVVGIQELRALATDLRPPLRAPLGFHAAFQPAQRLGYSGVALFARRLPDRIDTSLGEPRFDCEGRLQVAHFGRLAVANVYFPKGSGRHRDNSRVPYKLAFYRALFERLEHLRRSGKRLLVMGDFNTAHCEIDLARPRANQTTSGFLPEERAELDRWLAAGWVDTFRHFESGPGHYTWWSQRFGVRAKNVGWRIDYILASAAAMPFVRGAFIHPHVGGSDHCPVGVDLDLEAFDRNSHTRSCPRPRAPGAAARA